MKRLAFALLLFATTALADPCGPRNGSYAYSIGQGRVSISGATRLDDFLKVKKRLGENFLWVKLNGRSYVIEDEQFLDRVTALFAPLRALSPEIERVAREEEELDEQIDAIEDGPDEDKDEAKLDKLRARIEEVHKRERQLDKKSDALSCEAEKKMWPMIDEAIKSGKARRL